MDLRDDPQLNGIFRDIIKAGHHERFGKGLFRLRLTHVCAGIGDGRVQEGFCDRFTKAVFAKKPGSY